MKKVFLLLTITLTLLLTSCNKDECTQEAYSEIVSNRSGKSTSAKGRDKVTVCHNGNTIEVSANALQAHLDHGDVEGSCETLSDRGLTFSNGSNVQIDCSYELPFIHVDDNGVTWFFSDPK